MKISTKFLFEEWMMIGILIIQVALVCVGVLSRYLFNWSLSYTEELARYLLIWLTCLGFSAGLTRQETIRFQWPGKRSLWREKGLRWFGIAMGTLFSLILLITSLNNMLLQWRYHQPTSVMGWPIVWVSAALPVAALLYLFRTFRAIR